MKKSCSFPERLFWSGYLISRIRGQGKASFRSREKLSELVNSRVRNIIRFASREVPYYRDLFQNRGFRLQDFQTPEDLGRLPVLLPVQVRKNPEMFRPARIRFDTVQVSSSGTTGVPRDIHHDAVSVLNNTALGERSRFFYSGISGRGRNFREARLVVPLGSSSQEIADFIARKTLFPSRFKTERRYLSMLDAPELIIAELNEFRPDVIRGYGSVMNILAESWLKSKSKPVLPQVIVYVADAMAPALKQAVIEKLGIPVFSEYSSVECLQLGFECEQHNGYHLHEDACVVRIVDDDYQPLPDGVIGRIIVSNLVNRANVLLNYELGDEGSISPGPCTCGRTLKVLDLRLSRIADRLKLKDGTEIHPITFAQAVFGEDDLWQHQVVQESADEFTVFLVADPEADREGMKRRLAAEFESWFGTRLSFAFRFVDRIELTPRGKQKAVVFRQHESR